MILFGDNRGCVFRAQFRLRFFYFLGVWKMLSIKKSVSVLLTIVMMISIVTPFATALENACYGSFISADYSADPGQYMVNIARAQLNRTGASFGKYTTDWCAYFVVDCARVAGQFDAFTDNGYIDGRVTEFSQKICNSGGFEVPISEAKVGDVLCVMWQGNSDNRWDHTELVTSVSGSTITSIGGNVGEVSIGYLNRQVKETTRNLSYFKKYKVVRPNYQSTATNPPSAPTVFADKTNLAVNEPTTLHWSVCDQASYYWVTCWQGDSHIMSEEGVGFNKTISFSTPGEYVITAVACNSLGETHGNWVAITVYDKVPSPSTVTMDKTILSKNESTTVRWTQCNDAESYYINQLTWDY